MHCSIFAPGRRVRVLTGREGTVVELGALARRYPWSVAVQLELKTNFGVGRPRRIRLRLLCRPEDVVPL